MSNLIGKKFPVLDQGFVMLTDVMGDDAAICQAARVSFGKGTKSVSDDRTLIRYLMRHHHGTPLEMCEIKLLVRVPMDTWRQWIRHRTASVNEYSTRYSEAIDAMQTTLPDAWRTQATGNRQGSGGVVEDWPDQQTRLECDEAYDSPGAYLSYVETEFHKDARNVYRERLGFGVAREQARKDLPLSLYTEAFWKCDLRNVLHFLSLRMDSHAQHEIRCYANVIGWEIVAELFPLTWGAFQDYVLNAVTLSGSDVDAVRKAASTDNQDAILSHFGNAREREECRAKLVRLGLISEGS
jgi:thymidylate synthase (FAD)